MKTLYVSDLFDRSPQAEVTLQAWLRTRRVSGGISFLDVVDSTGMIQVVAERKNLGDSEFEKILAIQPESALTIQGRLARHHNKTREIVARSIKVLSHASLRVDPRPRTDFNIFDAELTDTVLGRRHLYLRNPKIMAILKFRSQMKQAVREWFEEKGFVEIDAPILTPVPLYDDASAMGIKVHDENVFLTQCVGYYLEAAVQAFERVWNMGPSFRGEESRSPRHLMEYHHIKAEIAFADLEDIIHLVEDLIGHICRSMWANAEELGRALGTTLCLDGLQTPYPRMSYERAIEYLRSEGFDIEFGKGLGGAEEKKLSDLFPGKPFWVTGIPRVVEPFPYSIDPADTRITRVADLIASNGCGELLGVAEKIYDPDMLDERLGEKGKLGDKRYEWIREVHRLGCVPHAAFGMGVERMIRWMLGVPHVRDAIPFPRIFRRHIAP